MLTRVREELIEEHRNFRLLFGTPTQTRVLVSRAGHSARHHWFAVGERFALDLWTRNAYGTIRWRCFVCESVEAGAECVTVPCVYPAARVLLSTQGAAQSRLFLAWLRELEGEGRDPRTCPGQTFEAAHFRLQGLRADRATPRHLSGQL